MAMVDDHRGNPRGHVFSTADQAVAFAQDYVASVSSDVVEEPVDGWLWHATFSSEGDAVWVYPTGLDEGVIPVGIRG